MWAVDLDAAGPGKAGPCPGDLKRPGTPAEEGLVTGSPSYRHPRSPADGRAGRGRRALPQVQCPGAPGICLVRTVSPRSAPAGAGPAPGRRRRPGGRRAGCAGPVRPTGRDREAATDEAATERAVASAEALLVELRVRESGSGMPAALASLGPGGRFLLAGAVGALLALLLVGGTALLGLVL